MEDFSKYVIKDYKYWQLQVHSNQGCLGRFVIWCKRKDALDLAHATKQEHDEFFIILKELTQAVNKIFKPDWFNYAFLGNTTKHLHCHFISRYSTPRQFEGMTFIDVNWGKNYKTDKTFVTPPHILEAVKVKVREILG